MATLITTAFLNTEAQITQNSFAKLQSKANTPQLREFDKTSNYILTSYKNTSTLSKAWAHALKDFAKSFKSPANTTWYDDGEGGFLAYFKDSTTYTRVDYNKKGNWVYTLAFYSENELPSNISADVKIAFPGFAINSVQEIHIRNLSAYLIHVEDKNGYKTLRYTDEGGVEEIEDLRKYNPHS